MAGLCALLFFQGVVGAQELQKVTPNARVIQRTYVNQQLNRLLTGQYAELEKEVASPSLADAGAIGLTKERTFFAAFRVEDWQKPPNWDAIFKSLDQWEAAFPTSPASRLARSTALIGYAWWARGNDVASTVTQNGWKLFGERLVEDFKKLEEARKLGGDKEPVYWTNLLTVGRGLQVPHNKMQEIVNEGLKHIPDNPGIYYSYCIAILPRWGGSVGEWQDWINAQNKDARWGGKEMDPALYAQILWLVFDYIRNSDGPFFASKKLSWEKAKTGLDQLCSKYPKSVYWKTARARFAWVAGDTQTLRSSIAALNGSYDSWAVGPSDMSEMLASIRPK
jgi:hypothetical protein